MRSARSGPGAQLRLLAANVQDHAIFLLDGEGRVASWNAGAQRMFGWAARDVLGRAVDVLYGEDVLRARPPAQVIAEVERLGRVEEEGTRVRRDGTAFVAAAVLTAVRGRGGGLQGVAVVTRDVTAARRAEEERDRLAHVQEVARVQTAFLGALAHELRTPVASLRLEVESVVRQLRREQRDAHLDRLLPRLAGLTRQSERLARLIDAFLALPRFGGPGAALAPAPLDPAAVFRAVAAELRHDPAVRGVAVAVRGRCPVRADRALFELVAWILLANALRYGAGSAVRVRIARRGPDAVVTVRDGGIGIAPADQARIFDPFERAVPSTSYAGLGLGLWLGRQIAEAHGGSLTVESAPGRGATFVLRLPQPA